MKVFSVAQVRASLARLLVKARNETVVIARYGKPVGLLLGIPPHAANADIKKLANANSWARLQNGARPRPVVDGAGPGRATPTVRARPRGRADRRTP